MKSCLCLLLLGGCLAGTLDANSRPAVIPKLSEMPADKRDEIQAQAQSTSPPEGHAKLSKKERKVETAAAYAAAIIGSMYSKHQTVLLGTSTSIDENRLFEKKQEQPAHRAPATGTADEESHQGQLLPWIRLDGAGSGSSSGSNSPQ